MSRFLITMNMPSRQGSSVHQIIAEHPASTLEELMDALQSEDFLVVDEYYKDQYGSYYKTGRTLLNHRYVGKVRLFVNDAHAKKHNGE